MRLVWKKLMEGNIVQMFSDQICITVLFLILFILPLQIALVMVSSVLVGALRLDHYGVFFASSGYFEPSSEFVVFLRIVPALWLWMDSDAFICSAILSTQYILLFT